MLLNILAVGDVVGEGGLDILSRRLDGLRQETEANFVGAICVCIQSRMHF